MAACDLASLQLNRSCFNVTRPQKHILHSCPTGNSPPLCVCPNASCVTKIAQAPLQAAPETHTHKHAHTQTA